MSNDFRGARIMQMNCNFFTVVGLTDDERCLTHYLCLEKHWGFERIMKMFSTK